MRKPNQKHARYPNQTPKQQTEPTSYDPQNKEGKGNPKSQPTNNHQGRPSDIPERFDTLFKQRVGSLLVAQLNVNKIGRNKRSLLSEVLNTYGVDGLAMVEHHQSTDDYM